MFSNGGIQDIMLWTYIDKIFDKYDIDRSGTLDENEMAAFFNELFTQLGMNKNVTIQESMEAIKTIDSNSDGKVDKKELFQAFKKLLGTVQAMPPRNQMQGYPGGYQGGYQGYPPQQYGPGYGYGQPPGYGGYGQSPFYPNQPMYSSQPVYNNQVYNQPPPMHYSGYQNPSPYNQYPSPYNPRNPYNPY